MRYAAANTKPHEAAITPGNALTTIGCFLMLFHIGNTKNINKAPGKKIPNVLTKLPAI